jgi:7,8-dihydro-6-hydroxymethylpterin-pyrophosphokinase
LDILFYGDTVLETPCLYIPHPNIPKRRFVLTPLADLSPGMIHPTLGRSVLSLLSSCPDTGLVMPDFCPISLSSPQSIDDP